MPRALRMAFSTLWQSSPSSGSRPISGARLRSGR